MYRGADIDLFLSDAAKAHVAFRGACPGSKIAAFATFGEAAMKEGKSMQMAVTAALSKRALRELRHVAPKEQKLAIIAASGKATAWLDANCRFVDYRLSDGALRDAVGQLLGCRCRRTGRRRRAERVARARRTTPQRDTMPSTARSRAAGRRRRR